MKYDQIPFTAINWADIPETRHPGETGFAIWRTVERGNVRVRMVEYSPGYLADHWCPRGHVIHILKGEMVSEMKDGTKSFLKAGMTYMMSDDETNPHRTYMKKGVSSFIVD